MLVFVIISLFSLSSLKTSDYDLNITSTVHRSFGYMLYDSSSTTPLNANQIYTSETIDVSEYSLISTVIAGAPKNAPGKFYIEFSPNGNNWDRIIEINVENLTKEPPHTAIPISRYCRLRYINGSVDQEEFRLQAVFHRNAAKGLTAQLEQPINSSTDVENVRAVIVGRNEKGDYANVRITSEDALSVDVKGASSAFGEIGVSEPTTVSQIQFTYGFNPALMTRFLNKSGMLESQESMIKLSTGTNTNSMAKLQSNLPIRYNPGQGAFCRFSAIFDPGIIGSTQYIGVGDESNGLFFGYKDTQFGILRRTGGAPEVRKLTLTEKADQNQNINIILDGETKTVSLTAANDITETANEIAAADYSQTGSGWTAHVSGNTVLFIAWDASSRNGSYSLVATENPADQRPEGSFTQTISGKSPKEYFVSQSNWNIDKYDGTGKSGITLDPTKGNVYQIRWQWLGFGAIAFFVENPTTGILERVHIEQYPNKSLTTNIGDPNMPLHLSVKNSTNTTNVSLRSGSIAGFVDGKDVPFGIRAGANGYKDVRSTEVPILTIKNSPLQNEKINNARARVSYIFFGSNHSEPIKMSFYTNATLKGASFNSVAPFSFMEYDNSATDCSGGTLIASHFIEPKGKGEIILNFDPTSAIIPPGSSFTMTAQSIGANKSGTVHGCFNFIELK